MKQNHSGRVVGKPYLGITSHLPVIRPGSMPSAEITAHKPTCQMG